MREFTKTIDKAFVNGLRPEGPLSRGAEYLVECKFCKPRPFGIRESYDVISPFSSNQFSSWPFPQLIKGRVDTLLCGDTSLKIVDTTTWPWTIGTSEQTFDFYNQTTLKGITSGGVWHIADFGESWILTNGVCNVFKTKQYYLSGNADKIFVQDATPIQTMCSHRGRAIFGGFDPTSFWTSDWENLINGWLSKSPVTQYSSFKDIGENFVWWTSIGGGDLLMLFDPSGNYVSQTIDYMEILRRNETGFMPMETSGEVLCVKPLGRDVIVYTEDSVYRMFLVNSPYPTYGFERLVDIGVADRGGVGGDLIEHVFVDTSGDLWRVRNGELPKRIGYSEFIGDMVGNDIVVSFDSLERHYYISGEDSSNNRISYVLTDTGLGHLKQQITSAIRVPEGFVGVYDTEVDSIAYVCSEQIDFGYRDLKTITTIEVGGFVGSNDLIHVAVDWRMEKDGSWNRSNWVLVNNQGFARIQITALEFRVLVKFSDYVGMELDYVNVHWQPVGRRTIRGIGVSSVGV